MSDQPLYTCKYCFKEFEPKRRRVQKYCSDTCRSKAFHARKTITKTVVDTKHLVPDITKTTTPSSNDKMSIKGIGNATAGSLLADGLKALLTASDNKPATKGDIKLLLEKISGRYFLVNNIVPLSDGRYPYFDIETGDVVYLNTMNENSEFTP